MRDFFLQIVLFIVGAFIGIAVPLLKPVYQKWIAGILSISAIIVSLVWFGYELGARQTLSTPVAANTVNAPSSTPQVVTSSRTPIVDAVTPKLPPSALPFLSSTPSPTEKPPPTATLTFTYTPPPSTDTPSPTEATILYQADWSGGLNGWFGSQDWKTVDGMLVSDGTNGSVRLSITAPAALNTIDDYAVEAEIQVVRALGCSSFGVVARIDGKGGGYQAGINYCEFKGAAFWQMLDLGYKEFQPGSGWHTYRLEVQGNNLKFLIDEALALETSDNRYLSGGQVGLWSDEVQLNIRSFKVIKLDQ